MLTDRRQFLASLGSFALSASALAVLSGCNTAGFQTSRQKVALLVPKSGRAAGIGQNLEQTARVAAPQDDPYVDLVVLDSGGEPASAAAAAETAVRGGARMILGPVFGTETQAVAGAVGGRVPVIAFTNDSSLAGPQSFIFGLTPEQSVAAILGYARARGLSRIAVLTKPGDVSSQAATAALRLAPQGGLKITAIVPSDTASLARAVKSAGGGGAPQAVLIPFGGEEMIAAAGALNGSGLQLLGTEQWLGRELASRPAFDKAWFSAPVPSQEFNQALASAQGATPGLLAGLVYDAVNMARVLAVSNAVSVAGVTRASGFSGALGKFRFRPDGRCERSLAILSLQNGREQVVATNQEG